MLGLVRSSIRSDSDRRDQWTGLAGQLLSHTLRRFNFVGFCTSAFSISHFLLLLPFFLRFWVLALWFLQFALFASSHFHWPLLVSWLLRCSVSVLTPPPIPSFVLSCGLPCQLPNISLQLCLSLASVASVSLSQPANSNTTSHPTPVADHSLRSICSNALAPCLLGKCSQPHNRQKYDNGFF